MSLARWRQGLPLPKIDRATLRISTELTDVSAAPVKGILRGSIAGTDVKKGVRLYIERGNEGAVLCS